MSSVSSYKALNNFSQLDNQFINNNLCVQVVNTRFAVKKMILDSNSSYVGAHALSTINNFFNRDFEDNELSESRDPFSYIVRKIDGFTSKVTGSQEITAEEKITIATTVTAFINACLSLSKSEEAAKLMDDQTNARQAFKEEAALLLQGKSLEETLNVVSSSISSLDVDQRTKNYITYKFSYMDALRNIQK